MRAARALSVLATALSMSACSTESLDAAAQPTPSPVPISAGPGAGAHIAVGETASFSILTHCGVESATINGHWWNAVTPLYGTDGEGTGPPAGWGDPWQPGTLTMETGERAVFEALGQRFVLKPSPTDEPIRICR